MPALIIQSGKRRGKKLLLPDVDVVIGRDEGCQIRLSSKDVSRQHCVLRNSPQGLLVRDLGSQNGTLVNDLPIQEETLLKPGDLLRVGPMVFQVAEEQPQVQVLTDDRISDWLSDDDVQRNGNFGDTTVIKATSIGKQDGTKKFNSIAEEGADIIRRHREMVQQREQEQGGP